MTIKQRILLTGATGIIGGTLLASLSRRTLQTISLVRATSLANARKRVAQRLAKNSVPLRAGSAPLETILGDTTLPALGMDLDALAAVTDIIHCSGSTAFKDDEAGWAGNIRSATNIIELARRLRPSPRIFYVSTASVCIPTHGGVVTEDQPLDGFTNGYINSKRSAEQLFRDARDLDVTILRPSIVIGEGIEDKRMARSILWVVPSMAMLGDVPVEGDSRLDLVSVQFVADAMAELVQKKKLRHRCYHLSAGEQSVATCAQIVSTLEKHGMFVGEIRMHGAGEWPPRRRWSKLLTHVREAMDFYVPFLNADVVYDRSRITAELGKSLPPCPPVTDYVHAVMTQISQTEAIAESYRP